MKPHISVTTLGVSDVNRAKKFYAEGLGWPVAQDYGEWVCLSLDGGASGLGLYSTQALAADAGITGEGNGFARVMMNYLVSTKERVDGVLAEAERAGATIVKPGAEKWGGYFGYFADPDGHLWKVATGPQPVMFAAE